MKPIFIAFAACVAVFAVACGSDSGDVATLEETAGAAEVDTVTEDAIADVETAWMALAQCLRDNGLEVKDPVVDSKGLVQKPEPVEEAETTKGQLKKAYEVCGGLIEGVTVEKDSVDQHEYVDRLV